MPRCQRGCSGFEFPLVLNFYHGETMKDLVEVIGGMSLLLEKIKRIKAVGTINSFAGSDDYNGIKDLEDAIEYLNNYLKLQD